MARTRRKKAPAPARTSALRNGSQQHVQNTTPTNRNKREGVVTESQAHDLRATTHQFSRIVASRNVPSAAYELAGVVAYIRGQPHVLDGLGMWAPAPPPPGHSDRLVELLSIDEVIGDARAYAVVVTGTPERPVIRYWGRGA